MTRNPIEIRIRKKDIRSSFLALLMLAFLPSFVSRIISIPYWGYFCYLLIIVCDGFFLYRMKRVNGPILWTLALFGYLLLVTLINNTHQSYNCAVRTFLAVSMSIYLEYLFFSRSKKDALSTLMLSLEIFNYLNLISMLLFPAGMYRVVSNGVLEQLEKVEAGSIRTGARVIWLAGHQTMMIRFTLPAVVIALIYSINNHRFRFNLRSLLLICVCIMETVIAKSAGNYLFLAIFALIFLYFRFRGRLNVWLVILLIVLLYSFFLTSSGELPVFGWLSGILNREVQVSTRIPVWLNTLRAWLQKPIFGYGFIDDGSMAIRQVLGLGNPHSSYLWVLYEGGLIGLFLLLFYIFLWTKRKGQYWKHMEAKIAYAGMLCLLVCMFDDDHMFRSQFFLILFTLTYHIPELTGYRAPLNETAASRASGAFTQKIRRMGRQIKAQQ